MTTLKETVNKLTKLYSDLNDCNDGFTCSMIINDIELTLKSYGKECCQASLKKASEDKNRPVSDEEKDREFQAMITNPENIILL